ncbi:hypothetical protein SO802_018616 [Lithocarpus litseifolius]|uniref:NAC domain-containing protein n=1 Tax=Lithocarpus litseifolius TaxID=425828 RepID=A0AAW2CMI5_9ROSI
MEKEPSSISQLPPGSRFRPSDEELIVHYLQNKVTSRPLPATIIAEIDLYKQSPWELPKKALFGEDEWYFFSQRNQKYLNGARPSRATASGYWKASGTDKPILTSCRTECIGVKKALVFYTGQPPKAVKTDWIMDEYRLLDMSKPSRLNWSMRTISSLSFDASNKANSFTSVYGTGPNNLNTPIPVSSLGSYNNQLERKSSEENKYENFLSNEILKDRNENKDLQPSKTLAIYDMNYYNQDQSQDIFNPKPSGPIIN